MTEEIITIVKGDKKRLSPSRAKGTGPKGDVGYKIQMQDYGSGISCKQEYRDLEGRGRSRKYDAPAECNQQPYLMMQKTYGTKEQNEQSMTSFYRVTSISYESSSSNQQYQNSRHSNSSAPSFCSPPNSPLVGLVFDPSSSPNYSGAARMGDRNLNPERRSQNSWSTSNQEPIGTGAKKKIVKSHDKRNVSNNESRNHQDRYKEPSTDNDRRKDRHFTSESNTSLDFFAEGERMVSELCNITESNNKADNQKNNPKNPNQQEDKNKSSMSSEALLTALDKIVIHDQIPNQIVQLAVEACTDAENIAIAHHNRPCFKNIHSICAKTRSNVQKPDSAVANLHSQGIPWVIKNFIFSFVRILDGWKGVKELLCEKHDTFSRIENKYYSPNIRECFVQWQAVTKEMLTHIYKTFKCLDHGFTMEQKSFTHNYYATNSAAPRHQNQNKFQAPKPHISTPRPVSSPHVSPQPYNAVQPPWMQQNQSQVTSPTYNDAPWPPRAAVSCKKFPVLPPQSTQALFHLNEPSDVDTFQSNQFKCDPCGIRETKPRQSWTITNVPDFRNLEGMSHADQRELYNQLKHNMDAELGKAPGQPIITHMPCDLLQRREMELKAKMIPLSHVEKTLIPSMATAADSRLCYLQKNNSCGDTKEEADFFAAWGQILQKEPSDFIAHHAHNIQVSPNILTLTNNISGPVQFMDPDNDEYHEMTKVYMKPGSYKVPIKPVEPISPFLQSTTQDVVYENNMTEEINALKVKVQFPQVTLAPQPKCNLDSWPCLVPRHITDIFEEESKITPRHPLHFLDVRSDALDVLSSMTSDRAWEAAKQSAPKLMDFIHDGPKSDAARLYDALGLSADEFSDNLKQMKLGLERNGWPPDMSSPHFMSKEMQTSLDQEPPINRDILFSHLQETSVLGEDIKKYSEGNQTPTDLDDYSISCEGRNEDIKEMPRTMSYDQSGNYIRDETQVKAPGKTKVATSGMWYHPKKKQPLSGNIVKKFETILTNFSQIAEANFIQHDMDIKVAPRFYEVVKHPMCLHDIATKLKHSSYTESEQVVQDFRRIFNNVRLYLKTFPDHAMKKNLHKISVEFDKFLAEVFQNGADTKQNDSKADTGCPKKDDKSEVIKTDINGSTKSGDHKI